MYTSALITVFFFIVASPEDAQAKHAKIAATADVPERLRAAA